MKKNRETKVICPASYFAGLDGGNPHFTTKKELKQNRGVCAKCRAKFSSRHAKMLKPSRLNGTFQNPTHDDTVHFTDGHREPCLEFNYDSLDGQPDSCDSATTFASKAILKFALRLFEKGSDTPMLVWSELNALLFAAQLHPHQDRGLSWVAKNEGLRRQRIKKPKGEPTGNF